MRLTNFMICELTILDERKNIVSAINIIEDLGFKKLPAILPKMTVLIVHEKDSLDESDSLAAFALEISIRDRVVYTYDATTIDFKGKLRNRVMMEFTGFTIDEAGEWHFRVRSLAEATKGQVVADLRVNVVSHPEPATAQS